MTTKEENEKKLRGRFIEWYFYVESDPLKTWPDQIFDWFYSEIEDRDKVSHKKMQDALLVCHTLRSDSEEKFIAKLQAQEQLLKAAEEVISFSKNLSNHSTYGTRIEEFNKALEVYTTLKSKTP